MRTVIAGVVSDAVAGREGMQLVTDQGTPYLAEAAQQAYDAIGVEHALQREGAPTEKAPTEKATVERGFGTIKTALAPIYDTYHDRSATGHRGRGRAR